MTIGDHPDWLAVGYLLNQGMLKADDEITAIDHDDDLEVIVVRTERETNFEEKMKKKTRTSGCAQGTVFGDMMENFESIELSNDATIKTSWLYELTKKINTAPSLYLKAGAIHGCVLCQGDRPLVYLEDVGRHNAVDKIAGWMFLNKVSPDDKIFYTTGQADVGDDPQMCGHAHPHPSVPVGLHRMGRGPCPAGGHDGDWPGARQAVSGAVGGGAHRV
jgi:FdhD protein